MWIIDIFNHSCLVLLLPSHNMCRRGIQILVYFIRRSRFPWPSPRLELMHAPAQGSGTKPSAVPLIIEGNRVYFSFLIGFGKKILQRHILGERWRKYYNNRLCMLVEAETCSFSKNRQLADNRQETDSRCPLHMYCILNSTWTDSQPNDEDVSKMMIV
jgi:hypothetical protein